MLKRTKHCSECDIVVNQPFRVKNEDYTDHKYTTTVFWRQQNFDGNKQVIYVFCYLYETRMEKIE